MSVPLEGRATPRHRLGMSPARFLRDYWQKYPLLIRRAFADLDNPVEPDDLAGLACEDLALARIAIHAPETDRWTLRSGPFTESDFANLPKTHWTLLVQDVDKWDADVAALLAHFAFLPSWRIDDVMVSYAEDGGSVGAHVDQYDVFLLQSLGRRRWQIDASRCNAGDTGEKAGAERSFRDDTELKLLRSFTPTHEWVLEPGDLLYLPPGVPHHGVALGACMTCSIGMRAPSQAELLLDFAESMAETLPESLRLSDPDLTQSRGDGEIDDTAIARVLRAMPWLRPAATAPLRAGAKRGGPGSARAATLAQPGVDAAVLRNWFGRFITRYRSAQLVAAPPRRLSDAAFARALVNESRVQRNPWSRFAWTRTSAGGAILFVAGESHPCTLRLARLLCAQSDLPLAAAASLRERATVRTLIDAGHLTLVHPTRSRRLP